MSYFDANAAAAAAAYRLSAGQPAEMVPDSSALNAILRRIRQVRSDVEAIHIVADRAFGPVPQAEQKPYPVPCGLVGDIEAELDGLISASNSAVARLSSLA